MNSSERIRTALCLCIFASVVLLAACSRAPKLPPARATANRHVPLTEVQQIFTLRCIACHAPGAYEDGTAMGGLVLSSGKAASQLVGVKSIESPLPRVQPGDLTKSYLYHKLRGSFAVVGGTGVQMPLGTTGLPEEEIALIEDWILSGAPAE